MKAHRINIRDIWILLVTLITLGSGIITINSVIGPSLPERRAILEELFPLEFLHISRFVTLVIGFVLVISSFNIYRRKKQALYIVSLLAIASIIFHLTKGLDYEEAIISALLLVVLFLNRKSFTVKSRLPDPRSILPRLGMAALLAFGYGVAGFWFLDKREFGIDFNITDAMQETWQLLSFGNDTELIPRTHYAVWFLKSFYLMTATALIYIIFTFFRPMVYRFRVVPREREAASRLIREYGQSSLDYFKTWPDKSFFFSSTGRCFLAYRVSGNFAIVLGDPVGRANEIEPVIADFSQFCRENGWGWAFYQTLPDFLSIYGKSGLKKMKIGEDAIADLTTFSLQGQAMKEIRHSINRLEKLGYRTALYKPPIPDDIFHQIRKISDEWLTIPGRKERGFTLGWFEPNYVRSTPIFSVLNPSGQITAFVNLIPDYVPKEATIDLMRRSLQAPNGVMDFLFAKLFAYDRERGYERFSLGMAPMAGFDEKEKVSVEERAVYYFFQHLNFIFSYSGLKQYKAKYASYWEPRYIIYRNALDLPRLARALYRVSEIKRWEWRRGLKFAEWNDTKNEVKPVSGGYEDQAKFNR